jgi:hypothetical protein
VHTARTAAASRHRVEGNIKEGARTPRRRRAKKRNLFKMPDPCCGSGQGKLNTLSYTEVLKRTNSSLKCLKICSSVAFITLAQGTSTFAFTVTCRNECFQSISSLVTVHIQDGRNHTNLTFRSPKVIEIIHKNWVLTSKKTQRVLSMTVNQLVNVV